LKILEAHTGSGIEKKLVMFIETNKLVFSGNEWYANYPDGCLVRCALLNNNEEIIGTFMYFRFRKFSFRFVITPVFAPNSEMFFVNPSLSVVGRNSFVKEALETVSDYLWDLKADYLNINLPVGFVDTQPFTWKGFAAKTRYSYLIDLSLSQETLLANLASEKRKSLNKAQKDNIEVKPATEPETVYKLITMSLGRNFLDKNTEVIKNIVFKFSRPGNSFAFVAYLKGEPAGASFCVIDRDKAVYIFGGFDEQNKHHGAQVSCMWQSILKAKELGLKYFDFEGSMNPRIERYFREFGGELRPYYCIEKISTPLRLLLMIGRHKLLRN
jgi:hypothetical protein